MVLPLLREVFFGQELPATLEVAVSGVLVLLRNTVRPSHISLTLFMRPLFLASESSPSRIPFTVLEERVVSSERGKEKYVQLLLYIVHLFLRNIHTMLLHSLHLTLFSFYSSTRTQLLPGVLSNCCSSTRRLSLKNGASREGRLWVRVR